MMKRKIILASALWAALLFGGCQSTELEQRSFPLAVGIDLQQNAKDAKQEEEGAASGLVVSFDFPDLAQISEKGKTTDTPIGMSLEGADIYHVEKSYENNTNRVLDYNHIKAIVLGEELLADSRQLRSLLLAWERKDSFARNTSLLVGKGSAAEVLSLTGETEGSMGKYLEEMLESQKDFKQNKIATIGSLMNQWHNQDQLLLIPVLEERGGRPAITGYAAVQNFTYRTILTAEEAMQVFFCQNLLQKFTCEPKAGQAAEIYGIQTSVTVDGPKDAPVATVSMKGKGRMLTGQPNSVALQYQQEQEIEKLLAKNLQETAEKLRKENNVDMSNSFRLLGGLNRRLYEEYQDSPDRYSQNVRLAFQADIDLVNWE